MLLLICTYYFCHYFYYSLEKVQPYGCNGGALRAKQWGPSGPAKNVENFKFFRQIFFLQFFLLVKKMVSEKKLGVRRKKCGSKKKDRFFSRF